MAQETALQVIELQQLPIIVERLHSVKADIEQRTADALSLVCTEQTYKSVKDARAQLTKEFKEYEAQRIAVKEKILEPYTEFEKVYRECVTVPFQTADTELKRKITDVTSGIVAQKTDVVQEYYNELVAAAGMESSAEVMVEYRKNLDLPTAIKVVDNRHKALEEQRRMEEERRVRQAEREAAAEKVRAAAAQTQPEPAQEISVDPEMPVQPDVEPVSQPKPEPILMTRFYAKGTKAQLIGLKNYLEKEGIEYGNV